MVSPARSGVFKLSSTCVLVVDDDADAADLYAHWLRDAGHGVNIANDAPRALLLAPVVRPAVVLIDLGLPGIDGIELVRELRVLPDLRSSCFVAVTAYADTKLPARCEAAGFWHFFSKPTPREDLLRSVALGARVYQCATHR